MEWGDVYNPQTKTLPSGTLLGPRGVKDVRASLRLSGLGVPRVMV